MTDPEALKSAASTTWDLVRQFVFPGEAELLKELPVLTISGESSRIEFRIQQDLIDQKGGHERAMVVLRFAPTGSDMPEPCWTLYVQGH